MSEVGDFFTMIGVFGVGLAIIMAITLRSQRPVFNLQRQNFLEIS